MTKKEAKAWCKMLQRMLSAEELEVLYPSAAVSNDWCRARHPIKKHPYSYPRVHCTRSRGHDGPHIDYLVDGRKGKDIPFLIWIEDD